MPPGGPPIVALVASAGGLRAIGSVLRRLPHDLPAAVVALVHLDPEAESALPAIFQRDCDLPVRHAVTGDRLQPGRVLVVPPGRHLLVRPVRQVLLIPTGELPPPRPSADLLLATLATAAGPRAVAVVLSGHGNDGATGASAIHAMGGTVLAADEASSTVFAMPRATITRDDAVDRVLPVEEIAAAVVELAAAP